MTSAGLLVVIGGLAAGWAVQLLLVMRQTRRFSSRLGVLRETGTAAVGRGGSRLRGFTYVALAADDDDRVVAAEAMRGATVFAHLKPADELVGRPLRELVRADGETPRASAAAMAATAILERPALATATSQRT